MKCRSVPDNCLFLRQVYRGALPLRWSVCKKELYMNIKQRILAGIIALAFPAMFAGILSSQAAPTAQAFGFAHPAFQRVWERTDLPVAAHQANRSWYWGPAPNSPGLIEPNRESPGGFR